MDIEKGLRFSAYRPYNGERETGTDVGMPLRQAVLSTPASMTADEILKQSPRRDPIAYVDLHCRLVPKRCRENLTMSLTEDGRTIGPLPMLTANAFDPATAALGMGAAATAIHILYNGQGEIGFQGGRQPTPLMGREIWPDDAMITEGDGGLLHVHTFHMIQESVHESRKINPNRLWAASSNHSAGQSYERGVLYFPFGGFFKRGAPLDHMEPVYGRLLNRDGALSIHVVSLRQLKEQRTLPGEKVLCPSDQCLWVCTPPPQGKSYPLSLQDAIQSGHVTFQTTSGATYVSAHGFLSNPWEGLMTLRFVPKNR